MTKCPHPDCEWHLSFLLCSVDEDLCRKNPYDETPQKKAMVGKNIKKVK